MLITLSLTAIAVVLGALLDALAVPALLAVAAGAVAALSRVGALRAVPLALACGAGIVHGYEARQAEQAPPPPVAGSVPVEGVVWAAWCEDGGRCRVALADARVGGAPWPRKRVTAYFHHLEAPPRVGQAVRLSAEVRSSRAADNPSPFAGRAPGRYLHAVSVPEADVGAEVAWSTAIALAVRERLDALDPDVAALFRAVVLGDRLELSPSTRWAFQDTGTAHLLAISGLHLALVGFGLYRLLLALALLWPRLAQAGRPPAVAAAGALVLLWGFGEIIAPSDATRRALVFMTLHLGAVVLARASSARRALLVAAALAVVVDPLAALRPSFQLSFAAAGSLVLGAPAMAAVRAWVAEPGRFERAGTRRVVTWAALLVTINLLTFVATAPLAAAWFGQIAPHGLWVNLLAVPLMTILVLPIGFAWVALSLALPGVAALVGVVPEAAASLLLGLVREAAALGGPATTAAWPVGLAVLAVVGLLASLAHRRLRMLGAAVMALAIALALMARAPAPPALRLTALDVGHGDALVVELPDGGVMMVDAGGTWQGGEADRRLVDRILVPALTQMGISRLDVLLVTHDDRDHIGGALPLVERVGVGELWLAPCAARTRRGKALAARVLARGGRVRLVHAHPPIVYRGAELEILWPRLSALRPDGRCRYGPNDASVAMSLGYAGRRLLLTADIEADAEASLVAEGAARLRADVLKAAHHGSKTSSTQAFLSAVKPQVVVVSGLPGRLPMPPHPSVLDRFRALGREPWITGRDGSVAVTVDARGTLTVRRASEASKSRSEGSLRPP
ncbi:MAG: DNA internalization-related competence protein ComEC/Rec2 [Proteobacteria bacterium]|nr:MAG: DNA internalization-related competence protein ComEC/Rec2 [Pseudomonadota bacterium]